MNNHLRYLLFVCYIASWVLCAHFVYQPAQLLYVRMIAAGYVQETVVIRHIADSAALIFGSLWLLRGVTASIKLRQGE
jgi:hypothetical protein